LWRKYNGELPSNQNLRFHLIRERGFTEAGADELIGQFRRTIAFAGLASSDVLSDQNDDKVVGEEAIYVNPTTSQDREIPSRTIVTSPSIGQVREVPIPIQGAAWPALKAAFPMSEEAWTQMIAVLNAMKPGLVEPKKDS
jgi:hypothetical protein